MNKMGAIAGFGALVLALGAMPVMAKGGMRGFAENTFADMDADGSGKITEADLVAVSQVWLAKADTNGDGGLNAEELLAMNERFEGASGKRAAFMEFAAQWRVKQGDADGDGKLSAAELAPQKGFGRLIDRFDTDDDNALSPDEFAAAQAELQRSRRGGKRGSGAGKHGGRCS